jgi:hypothetical protein
MKPLRALVYRCQRDETCGVCGERAHAARIPEPADQQEANSASYVIDGPTLIVRGHRACVLKHVLGILGIDVHDSVDGVLYRNGKFLGRPKAKAATA